MDTKTRNFGAVIFDMDGTIIDSEPIFRLITKRSANELGFGIEDETYNSWIGLPRESLEKAIVNAMGPIFPMTEFKELFATNWNAYTDNNGIETKPGIPGLLELLTDREIPFAVATSTPIVQANRSLELAKIKIFVENVVGGDQVKHGKPAPDIFMKAANILRKPPEECIAIEDSAIGIQAATDAGMLTILIPDAQLPNHQTMMMADYVLPCSRKAVSVIRAFFP